MTGVYKHPTATEHELALRVRLVETQRDYVAALRELERARSERDDAVIEACQQGLSRRAVADVVGITPGRVQQLVASQTKRNGQRLRRLPLLSPRDSSPDGD